MTPRRVAIAVTLAVAATRIAALSRTLWDSDEALFVSALRHYDVAAHHPQPPGLPLFIGAAKLLTFAGVDGFHALQALNLIAAIALAPVMLSFALSLGADVATAATAAVMLAFFPNVWFYGGTALSDVPAMTLTLLACALVLRGRMWPGALVAAVAIGIRPQALLVIVPALLVSPARTRLRAFVAPALACVAIVTVSYTAAAMLSGGWRVYLDAIHRHQQYLATYDAWTSPTRPPLTHLVDDFFIRPYRAPLINILTTVLAVVAVIRRSRVTLLTIALFAPLCLATWLTLDRFSASRFAVAYAPLFAMLAAEALRGWRFAWPVAAVYVVVMIVWTWPALRVVRSTDSPPLAAAEWLRTHAHRDVYADAAMAPFADGRDAASRFVWSAHPGDWFLAEGRGAITFSRERGRLWQLARQRYFDVSLTPAQPLVAFGDGWYDEESGGGELWRWMGRRSTLRFLTTGRTLTIDFYAPDPQQTITLIAGGRVLDRLIAGRTEFPKRYRVDNPRELVVETDRVMHNGSDPRELGLRLTDVRLTN